MKRTLAAVVLVLTLAACAPAGLGPTGTAASVPGAAAGTPVDFVEYPITPHDDASGFC